MFRSSKSHPGPVVHISDNPMDEGKVCFKKNIKPNLNCIEQDCALALKYDICFIGWPRNHFTYIKH